MRIIKFSAENVKKLRAVEITPNGHVVEITGPNGQGKSSVLDAIFYAVAGTEGVPAKVVRQGEEKAFVRLELGDHDPELVVTRHFTAAGTTRLTVESVVGAVFKSPQTLLDTLVGELSFDPLEFIRLKPAEQLTALRKVVKLDVDLDQLEAKTKKVFDQRTETKRELKRLEARMLVLPAPAANTPDEPVDTGALVTELQQAGNLNLLREKELRNIEGLKLKAETYKKQVSAFIDEAKKFREATEREIENIKANLSAKLARYQEEQSRLLEAANQVENELKILFVTDPVDTVKLAAAINEAEVTNQNVARKKSHQDLQKQIDDHSKILNDQDATIEANLALRQQTIAQAKMPVEGLSIGDGEVTLNGFPLGNASSGEQLRVSVALAMAANPKLRVLRVKDGSLLDEANLKLLADLAELHDFQVWLERVEDAHGRPAVVMEDGHVSR